MQALLNSLLTLDGIGKYKKSETLINLLINTGVDPSSVELVKEEINSLFSNQEAFSKAFSAGKSEANYRFDPNKKY